MYKPLAALAAALAVGACEGNPFAPADGGPTTAPTVVGGVTLPTSETAPSASSPISRTETDGQAKDITYNASTDKITIDNLPFDGTGVFDRDDVLPTLVAGPNGFQIYENNNPDPRRAYKTIYGQSTSGETSVAVVRTGDYQGYGFGGFVYARNGGVTLPTTGQAIYTGNYAGLRVFDGASGLEYTTADARIEVDFEDFNATDAVEGTLTNRQYFDQAGTLLGTLPTLVLRTGSISDAGEIGGTAQSQVVVSGVPETFESGQYYAVLSGDPADEMVGIIVVTGQDPRTGSPLSGGEGVTVQETGGFIVTSP